MNALPLYSQFLNWIYATNKISVPSDFKGQCAKVKSMLNDDITGIVNTITGYAVNSASEAILKIECDNPTLEDLLNQWLSMINVNIDGVPTGLQALAKEYYKERWQGSSLCLMKVSNWQKISSGNTSIKVPTVLWFVNGSTVTIDRPKSKIVKLGTDKYYFDEEKNKPIKSKDEEILIQKPFSRWIAQYPTPYLVFSGVLKNWLALDCLSTKSDEVISKVLPYLFIVEKGDKDAFLQKDVNYTDPELKAMIDGFKTFLERYEQEGNKVPATGVPFDQKMQHLIPDLTKILNEELYRQGYRAILSGLGFVSVVQGIGDSRKEETINPKPFLAEVNAGVRDFKSMLIDVVGLISLQNKTEHRKLFSENKNLQIVNSPLKINVESIIDSIRSAFVYGTISIETYQETLGINPSQELERMRKEWKDGLRELYYPHLIQNTEKDADTNISPAPITKKQTEKNKEKETKPENMQEASLVTCKKCNKKIDYLKQPEAGMGYIKCPECGENIDQEGNFAKVINEPIDPNLETLEIAPYKNDEELLKHQPHLKKIPQPARDVFLKTFNDVYERTRDESDAFPVAYRQMNKYLKRHYTKNDDGTFTRKGEEK